MVYSSKFLTHAIVCHQTPAITNTLSNFLLSLPPSLTLATGNICRGKGIGSGVGSSVVGSGFGVSSPKHSLDRQRRSMSPFAGGPDYPSVRIRSVSPWLILAASLAYTLCLRLHALSADDRHSRSAAIAFCLESRTKRVANHCAPRLYSDGYPPTKA